MLKVVLSHDVDRTKKTYQFLTKPIRAFVKGKFSDFQSQLSTFFVKGNYWTFDEIIKIESDFNLKSTFFFLNESIRFNLFKPKTFILSYGRYKINDEKISELIKWLDINGWEIAVHGSFNSYDSFELLKKEKNALETIVGHEITGIRQHYLNLNNNTWGYQSKAGFLYDSSFGSTKSIGFIDNKFVPFLPFNDSFIVFPQVIMDTCFMSTNNRWYELNNIMDICEEKDAVMVINFHNHVFNEKEFPGYRSAYIKIIENCFKRQTIFYTFKELYGIYKRLSL